MKFILSANGILKAPRYDCLVYFHRGCHSLSFKSSTFPMKIFVRGRHNSNISYRFPLRDMTNFFHFPMLSIVQKDENMNTAQT